CARDDYDEGGYFDYW
nr:immunoglobulin heavy chain junction region [Mus musculus]NSM04728.1 immunoglobulin heavy chain junction region [Mus musculus]NSM04966.1 immunoglobulin heavy chain junction region [Mus musculus]NSM05295.1 immunoglobulin heavy chain junction region [Mus musculus]NSM05355.1 immunoglobulin heavy chain junction region [Mus musculus]